MDIEHYRDLALQKQQKTVLNGKQLRPVCEKQSGWSIMGMQIGIFGGNN